MCLDFEMAAMIFVVYIVVPAIFLGGLIYVIIKAIDNRPMK